MTDYNISATKGLTGLPFHGEFPFDKVPWERMSEFEKFVAVESAAHQTRVKKNGKWICPQCKGQCKRPEEVQQ